MKDLKNKITLKYHRHMEFQDGNDMMYFTIEDVHKCMDEYYQLKKSQELLKSIEVFDNAKDDDDFGQAFNSFVNALSKHV